MNFSAASGSRTPCPSRPAATRFLDPQQTATPAEGGWRLDGAKRFVSGSEIADAHPAAPAGRGGRQLMAYSTEVLATETGREALGVAGWRAAVGEFGYACAPTR